MAESQPILCPYCGEAFASPAGQCAACGGSLDEMSRRVTQQQMGPWFIRDSRAPYRPGCSYSVLRALIQRGKVRRNTILRGPTTRQFWSVAGKTPGVAHLLGVCHACGAEADPRADRCDGCGAVFPAPGDRQRLGLDADDPEVLKRAATAPIPRPARATGGAPRHPASTPPPTPSPPGHPPADVPEYADPHAADDQPREAQPAESGNSTSLLVWVLVALNVLLILAVATAIVLHMIGK